MPDSNYDAWKTRSVAELAAPSAIAHTPEQKERHRVFSLALMAITYHYWNGNKYGRRVQYPLNDLRYPSNPTGDPGLLGDDYLGHNIAAIAVDGDGAIIDFEFNHNEIFNSSVEHAESRLLRRVFGLAQVQDSWNIARSDFRAVRYGKALNNVTLYTTLESCAQCSGIMTLAALKEVIYLQPDPGQYFIGNIMRKMTLGTGVQAPEPIAASTFDFPYYADLERGYMAFRERPKTEDHALVLDLAGKATNDSYTTSITSFLCTKVAREIYGRAADELRNLEAALTQGVIKPPTNIAVVREALQFVKYATTEGNRGTPHRFLIGSAQPTASPHHSTS
ncbi:MAG: deaminase [Minicystis sp.]